MTLDVAGAGLVMRERRVACLEMRFSRLRLGALAGLWGVLEGAAGGRGAWVR